MCNQIFGFSNWSSEIRELRLYYTTEKESAEGESSYASGASAICRVVLRDGSHRDAIGVGECENSPSKMKSIEIAQQAASADGIRKCVQQFTAGNSHVAHPLLSSTSLEDRSRILSQPSSSSVITSYVETPTVSGHKRQFDEDTVETNHDRHQPHFTPSNEPKDTSDRVFPTNNTTPAASPTLEDIDLIMQQYDQVKNAVVAATPAMQGSSGATTRPPMSNITTSPLTNVTDQYIGKVQNSSNDSTSNSTILREKWQPPRASLKGQRYPSKPNLQDPFGKSDT